jgi:hypothetical protein
VHEYILRRPAPDAVVLVRDGPALDLGGPNAIDALEHGVQLREEHLVIERVGQVLGILQNQMRHSTSPIPQPPVALAADALERLQGASTA